MTEHDLTFRFYLRDDWSVSVEKLVRDSTEAQPWLNQGSTKAHRPRSSLTDMLKRSISCHSSALLDVNTTLDGSAWPSWKIGRFHSVKETSNLQKCNWL